MAKFNVDDGRQDDNDDDDNAYDDDRDNDCFAGTVIAWSNWCCKKKKKIIETFYPKAY